MWVRNGARLTQRSRPRTQRMPVRAAAAQVLEREAPPEMMEDPQPDEIPAEVHERPGQAEDARIRLTQNVERWRTWSAPTSAVELARRTLSAISSASSPREAQLWAYCLARSGFFAALGAGTYATVTRSQNLSSASSSSSSSSMPLNFLSSALFRLLGESLEMYRQDIQNIRQGYYKEPWDWSESLKLQHRQIDPLYISSKIRDLYNASMYTISKRANNSPPFGSWLRSAFGPGYHRNAFHFQEDGWMSSQSAQKYEVSTEALFLGRQDSMHRTVLRVLGDGAPNVMCTENQRVLELGCGTGRQHTFVRDNLPKSTSSVLLDMSPFYLQEARDNMQYWASKRTSSGYLPTSGAGSVDFVHGAAESLPENDESFDLVFSTYMMHEMPRSGRREMADEVARVLKPGGYFVWCDSMTLGDRPDSDNSVDNFSNLNEPFWRTFVRENFVQMFEDVGLKPMLKDVGSATKALLFKKPSSHSA